ncbi:MULTISPECIES: Gfo/Idh/MocA family oxidoreductase [unclassified Neisseria]|uniref:Gfo/Idh/MocA family oxidoreductase n=1 Tax=unclassified Neisseria TaxID=2623750 RepID=UPI001071BE83|nr:MULTISPECIES: Gfo/Idh/MocA family oxidoreductase [unclassified Neisseria]MBF0803968.1 Gfo/Idh/MocA family oxidoreductase [Neisseria sp. 19428wB4_WF04]TFU43308.1 gfo/Idh/MocA family oxidoreductase [Neisseria sp. WF04]
MTQTIKIGLAGFGLSAKVFHLPFWQADGRFKVVRVLQRSGSPAQQILPDAEIVRSFSGLLADDTDLIVITTPNQTHFEFAQQALLAGKHVVVEKPLCATAAQARRLAELAKKQGVVLTVYQNRRWDAALLTAKRLLSDGLLGDIVDCEIRFERYAEGLSPKSWKETGGAGVGLVYDLGSHLADMAVDLFGLPQEIYADVRRQHEGAVSDDNFQMLLYYPDGKKVSLTAGKYMREPLPFMALHGKRGSYVKQNADNQEALLAAGAVPEGDWNREPEAEWGILHTKTAEGAVIRQRFEGERGDYGAFYRNLYNVLANGAELAVKPQQAVQVLDLLEKAYQSAESKQRVEI